MHDYTSEVAHRVSDATEHISEIIYDRGCGNAHSKYNSNVTARDVSNNACISMDNFARNKNFKNIAAFSLLFLATDNTS